MQNISSEVSGTDVCRLFIERTGIIREPVVDQIDFTHRTFQEFLAAHAALDEEDIGLLIRNAHDDQWREVIILASGLASKKVCEYLIQELIRRGDKIKKHRYQLHLLAVSCLATSIELGQDVKAEVALRLSQLIPPKKMVEARSLASAGELAIPYLSKDRLYPDPINKMCIRTLALINGDIALDAIEEYACNASPSIINELLREWDFFDRDTYAQRVLSLAFRDIRNLRLNGLPSLEGCHYFTSLTSLNLSDSEEIDDLSPLSTLTQLTSLTITDCGVTDLSPLSTLTQLTSLGLSDCEELNNLNPLANLTRLTSLKLTFCKRVSDLRPLARLTNLTFLDLISCPSICNLFPLTNLTQLTALDLVLCKQIKDLAHLSALTQLTSLNLANCNQVDNLNPLSFLTQLTSLSLADCQQINDLSPLASLTRLTSLDLSNCGRLNDLSPLASLTHLASLDLSNCWTSDLHPLVSLDTTEDSAEDEIELCLERDEIELYLGGDE